MVEVINYRKDGTKFLNGVTIAPISDHKGEITAFIGSQSSLGDPPSITSGGKQPDRLDVLDKLSYRQRQAIIYLASGMPIKQIAHELELSERTVKMHRAKAMEVLGVTNTAEAIRLAIGAGY